MIQERSDAVAYEPTTLELPSVGEGVKELSYNGVVFEVKAYPRPADLKLKQGKNTLICDFDKVNQYDKIVLSPGPGLPSESSLLKPLIEIFASKKK